MMEWINENFISTIRVIWYEMLEQMLSVVQLSFNNFSIFTIYWRIQNQMVL